MGTEQPVEWYNTIYQEHKDTNGICTKPPEQFIGYNRVWQAVIDDIFNNELVADFGCGTGQFVNLLLKNGKKFSYGVDFSSVAISIAQSLNESVKERFYVGDLSDKDTFHIDDYDTAILLEVLEHIEDDLTIISNIPSGIKTFISVPNFDYFAHARHFTDSDSVEKRYSSLVNIEKISCLNDGCHFLASGRKR